MKSLCMFISVAGLFVMGAFGPANIPKVENPYKLTPDEQKLYKKQVIFGWSMGAVGLALIVAGLWLTSKY